MSAVKQYILNEVKVIENECLEKGISSSEWVERYAEEYHRKYANGSIKKVSEDILPLRRDIAELTQH